MLKSFDRQFKLIMLGTASCGKTSLLVRFVDDKFTAEGQKITSGMDLKSQLLQIESHVTRLQVWDTQG